MLDIHFIKDDLMKLILLFLLSFNLMAAEFKGYILKVKDNSFLPDSLVSSSKKLNISFGQFYLIDSKNSLMINDLKKDPRIDYIEPNYAYELLAVEGSGDITKSGDLFSKQWSLNNTGKNFPRTVLHGGVAGKDINALKGWEITEGHSEVIVGIMDSGIDYKHPELKNQLWINQKEMNGTEGVDDDGNGYIDDIHGHAFGDDGMGTDPMDYSGHGTHVAGIVAAEKNGIGVNGVAPGIKIMLLKTRSAKGKYYVADIVESLDYAIKHGATLVTSSIGGEAYSKTYLEVLERMDEAKMLYVQAAGNHAKNLDRFTVYPPSYNTRNMINVGNHSGNGKKWLDSNYSKNLVGIFAPGVNILSLLNKDFYAGPGRGGYYYKVLGGTSMAAPHVAGALALLYSLEPNIGHLEAKERLLATVVKERRMKNQCQSGGRLDIYRLLMNIRD